MQAELLVDIRMTFSRSQPDPSKKGFFCRIGNMSIDQIRKMSARIEKEKTQKEEVEGVDEAMRPGPRREKMRAKMHDPYVKGGSKSRGQAHNIAVRGDVSTGRSCYQVKRWRWCREGQRNGLW